MSVETAGLKPVNPFELLNQAGSFGIANEPTRDSYPQWRDQLTSSEEDLFFFTRNEILTVLGISSLSDFNRRVSEFETNPAVKDSNRSRVIRMIADKYNIFSEGHPYDETEAENKIKWYADTADEAVNQARAKVTAQVLGSFEIADEVRKTHDPVDLLIMALGKDSHPRLRFEARRKLVLMGLAGAYEQRLRAINYDQGYLEFLVFMDESFYMGEKGADYHVPFMSTHDKLTNETTKVEMITPERYEEIRYQPTGPRKRLFNWDARRFQYRGQTIPVRVVSREKHPASALLKLYKKDIYNPAKGLEDDLGYMVVLPDEKAVDAFRARLTQAARKADIMMGNVESEDTIAGGEYSAENAGSSAKLRQRKTLINVRGVTIELIVHTIKTYLDAEYKNEVAHDEYEVARLFDSGVMQALFPESIYDFKQEYLRQSAIRRVRKNLRETNF